VPLPLDDALGQLRTLLLDREALVRAVASGRRHSHVPTWRRVELRPVDLSAGPRLQVVAVDQSGVHTRNEEYGPAAEAAVEALLAEPFGSWYVQTDQATVQVRVTKRGQAQVHNVPTSNLTAGTTGQVRRAHDRAKRRLLDPADPLFHELGLADARGQLKPSRADKYRQVEQLLRALDAVLEPAVLDQLGTPVQVVDFGSGNAYLTFATYWFLTRKRALAVQVTGVDLKAQARDHGQRLAATMGCAHDVRFTVGSALDADLPPADVVLALHACDTATDEALARAVRWGSTVALAAPCCHHDVQRQLAAAGPAPQPYGLLARQPILRERFADVLTDGLRAAVLRAHGYRVDVTEFVGSQHTPRNTLLRAVHTGAPPTAAQHEEYTELTSQWGVTPRLAQLLATTAPTHRPEPATQSGSTAAAQAS
jgi:hypothetical protein